MTTSEQVKDKSVCLGYSRIEVFANKDYIENTQKRDHTEMGKILTDCSKVG